MHILAISYVINLDRTGTSILALAAILTLMAWSWGALLKTGLGLNRWFGLSMLIPIVNILAFIAAGIAAHRHLVEKDDRAAYEKIKRIIEDESYSDPDRAETVSAESTLPEAVVRELS